VETLALHPQHNSDAMTIAWLMISAGKVPCWRVLSRNEYYVTKIKWTVVSFGRGGEIWTDNILWLLEKVREEGVNHWYKLGSKVVNGKRLPSAKAGSFLARWRSTNCWKEVPYCEVTWLVSYLAWHVRSQTFCNVPKHEFSCPWLGDHNVTYYSYSCKM
jgi:hypothetical protein